jgi:hypothetical protein
MIFWMNYPYLRPCGSASIDSTLDGASDKLIIGGSQKVNGEWKLKIFTTIFWILFFGP